MRISRLQPSRVDDQGFTLVELLVVVVVMGILAAVAIPVFLSAENSAKSAGPMSDVASLKTAVVSVQSSAESPAVAVTTSWTARAQVPDELVSAGATFSGTTAKLRYVPASGQGFCLEATGTNGVAFAATSALGASRGTCSSAGAFVPTS